MAKGAIIGAGGVQYVEVDIEPTVLSNDQIRAMREQAYKEESDSLYMAYHKYVALGESEKAGAARAAWLDKINEINLRLPYNN